MIDDELVQIGKDFSYSRNVPMAKPKSLDQWLRPVDNLAATDIDLEDSVWIELFVQRFINCFVNSITILICAIEVLKIRSLFMI